MFTTQTQKYLCVNFHFYLFPTFIHLLCSFSLFLGKHFTGEKVYVIFLNPNEEKVGK